jgi:iron complex outermembrane receptor protein
MQILIDGRSTYTSSLSAIDWNLIGIQIEDIERIEVVHGPAASAYGSNSFAGAINIITKRPELDDKLSLKYRYGSHQERYALLRHSGSVQDFYYTLSASKRRNGGHEDYIETRSPPGSYQEQFFDDFRDDRDLNQVNFTGSFAVNAINEFWFNVGNVNGVAEDSNLLPDVDVVPGLVPLLAERDREMNAWHVNALWSHQISESQELKLNFFHNYYDTDDMTSTPPIYGGESAVFGLRSFHSHRSDLEITYSQINDNGFQFVVGAGMRYDTLQSDSTFPLEGEESNFGKRFFANAEMPITDRLTANVGGLYELNNTERPHFSPRASLNFRFTPHQSLRVGYSRAYRIPSLYEEYVDAGFLLSDSNTFVLPIFTKSGDIKAEKITAWDMSYLGQALRVPLSWEVRLYKEEYRDSVGFVKDESDPFEIKYVDNAADSNTYGVEGHITYRPSKTSFIRLHFNHGHLSGHRLHEINPVEHIDLSQTSPNKVYGILASKQVNSWRFNAAFYHTASIKWEGTNGDLVESYDRVDASVSKRFHLSNNQSLILKLAGQNILDENYNEFSTDTDISFDPRYYGSITLIHN